MYMEQDKNKEKERKNIGCVEEISNILKRYEISISEKDTILRIVKWEDKR